MNNTLINLQKPCGQYGEAVVKITGLTLDKIAELIYNMGTAYAENYPQHKYNLATNRIYWNWWKLQWYSDDCTYVAYYKNTQQDGQHYSDFHQGKLTKVHIEPVVFSAMSREAKKAKPEPVTA